MKNVPQITLALAIGLGTMLLLNFQNCAASNDISASDSGSSALSTGSGSITFASLANGMTTGPNPNLHFVDHDPMATLACVLDGVAIACDNATGITLTRALTSGGHTLTITSTTANGTQAPVTISWTVDATGPNVVITSPAAGATTGSNGYIQFTIGDGVTAECSFDGASLTACVPPYMFEGLAAGNHTITIHSIDSYGNVGPDASVTFYSDGTVSDTM